jgi:hypothetical protein
MRYIAADIWENAPSAILTRSSARINIYDTAFMFFPLDDPQKLRGSNFDASIICGEPDRPETLDTLALCMRLGNCPLTLKIL